MKSKYFCIWIWLVLGTSLFAQAKRDTIFIYDTIRITVKRPAPQPENFFEEKKINAPTATLSQDSIIIDEQEQIKSSSTMSNFRTQANKIIRKIAVGSMAAVSSITPMLAQPIAEPVPPAQEQPMPPQEPITDTVVKQIVKTDSVSEESPKKQAPFDVCFAYPVGIYGKQSEDYVFNVALGFLTSVVGGVNGVQASWLYNQSSGPVRGVQATALMNVAPAVEGVQTSWISNFTKDLKGIQAGGILNQSGNVRGMQTSWIMNAADNVEGIQMAGIYNVADSLTGLQSSWIVNEAETVKGVQASAIYNQSNRIDGLQIGLVNRTKSLSGVQIGLINKADTVYKGVSIGLFNFISKDRFRELELTATSFGSVLLNYRIGTPRFHCVIGAGTNYDMDANNVELRFGIGNQTRLANHLYLQTTLYSSNLTFQNKAVRTRYKWSWDNWAILSSGLVYYWGDKIGIKVMPSFHYWKNKSIDFGEFEPRDWGSYELGVDFGLSIKL